MLEQILFALCVTVLIILVFDLVKLKKELDVKRSENYWLKKVMADEGLIPQKFVGAKKSETKKR